MNLNGQRVVILGGTSGIGLATAQAAAEQGAQLVVASSRQTSVDAALAVLLGNAEGHALDIADAAAVSAFFDRVGAFDHLVYTAGEALSLMPLDEMEIAKAQAFFGLRYWGALAAAKAARPHIRPGGSIVFTGGIAGARPGPGWAVAASICAAMEGLTRALAVELAPLRVNAVAPGVVRTPLWREWDEAALEGFYAERAKAIPVGHVGAPEEVAKAYVYLMAQTYGSGQTLVVDGGNVLV